VIKRNPLRGEKTVRSQDLKTNTQNSPRIIFRSDIAEERGKVVPTLDEIHRRALEIHIERGDHSWDLDDYLDEWLQAERELQEKYNKSNRVDTKKE